MRNRGHTHTHTMRSVSSRHKAYFSGRFFFVVVVMVAVPSLILLAIFSPIEKDHYCQF